MFQERRDQCVTTGLDGARHPTMGTAASEFLQPVVDRFRSGSKLSLFGLLSIGHLQSKRVMGIAPV